jgi:hypothetical protein
MTFSICDFSDSMIPPMVRSSEDPGNSFWSEFYRFPRDLKTRFIIVEDLSMQTINTLGSMFRPSPEFFAEHLLNSGYSGASYNERPAQTWRTSHLVKSYASMKWQRPVIRLPVAPFSPHELEILLNLKESRLIHKKDDAEGEVLYEVEPNIFRAEWELWTDPATTTRMKRLCAWEERVSIWVGEAPEGQCKISMKALYLGFISF